MIAARTQELLIVGISDAKASATAGSSLVTHALGSCVGVTVFDRTQRIGGLLHLMLPESKIDPAEAARNPFRFADTGIPALIEQVTKLGATARRLEVRLFGGAQMLNDEGLFNIGQRNVLTAHKILWKLGCFVKAEETGGVVSRTVRLEIGTGDVWIRRMGQAEEKLR